MCVVRTKGLTDRVLSRLRGLAVLWRPRPSGTRQYITAVPLKGYYRPMFIDCVAVTKQGEKRFGSIHLSVCLSVCALTAEPFGLCVIRPQTDRHPNERMDGHYQVHYLPASLSYTVGKNGRRLKTNILLYYCYRIYLCILLYKYFCICSVASNEELIIRFYRQKLQNNIPIDRIN